GGDDLAADVRGGPAQQGHAVRGHGPALAGVGDQHQVTLVAHDTADLESLRPGQVGDPAGVLGCAAAAGEADVDVDEHLAQAAGGGRLDGLGRVDRDGDPGPVGQR